MGKKTNKFLYVIFGILAALFMALVPFAAARREALLEEGDLELADFSITMGIIGAVGCLIFVGIIALFLIRDRKTSRKQKLFAQELEKTPLFGRWLLNEEKQLKAKALFCDDILPCRTVIYQIVMEVRTGCTESESAMTIRNSVPD